MYLLHFFETDIHIDSHVDFRRVPCYIFDFAVFVLLILIFIHLSIAVINETLIVELFFNLVVFAFLIENMKKKLFDSLNMSNCCVHVIVKLCDHW
jgi:hypothetical protein